MKLFGTLDSKDYTVVDYISTAPISWELESSSLGINITSPDDLIGAVTIQRATNDPINFRDLDADIKTNIETGTYEYVLYSSIKHLFYDRGVFYSGSRVYKNPVVTFSSSIDPITKIVEDNTTKTNVVNPPNNSYVVSVGQNFYGDRIQPRSFEFTLESDPTIVQDDGYGNLFVSESGVGYSVGHIFYEKGIAVISHDTSSAVTSVNSNGIKIVGGTVIGIDYTSEVDVTRHEANVRLLPQEFNFSPFNPSILRTFSGSAELGQGTGSLANIPSSSALNQWNLYNLMGANIIKPYVTSIGLYNDKYELLAVAKLVVPIQRTFDMEQIFIVRFDT